MELSLHFALHRSVILRPGFGLRQMRKRMSFVCFLLCRAVCSPVPSLNGAVAPFCLAPFGHPAAGFGLHQLSKRMTIVRFLTCGASWGAKCPKFHHHHKKTTALSGNGPGLGAGGIREHGSSSKCIRMRVWGVYSFCCTLGGMR